VLSNAVTPAADSIFFGKSFKRQVFWLTISEILPHFNIPFLLHSITGHSFANELNIFRSFLVENTDHKKFIFKLL
jgi:hypothetical protein